ncbi:MAG: BON domain-containing protein [Gemmatimonadota bacterium]
MSAWTAARWMFAAAATGAAAVASVVVVSGRTKRPPHPTEPDAARTPAADTDALEERVVEALRADQVAGGAPVAVAALAEDMVELSGTVPRREEAERAVRVAQAMSGVRTVVNRLDVEAELRHAEETRARKEAGDPALNERGVYGLGVGMGRRRQSPDTDPDRPDDRNERISEELGAARVAEEELGATRVAEEQLGATRMGEEELEENPSGESRAE